MEFKDLVGKTIVAATHMKHRKHLDTAWLRLEFSDGTQCTIESAYSGKPFQDNSLEGEYIARLSIEDGKGEYGDDLIPIV